MDLRHVVAGTDESDAGRQAVRTAVELAARTGARVTVMRAIAVTSAVSAAGGLAGSVLDGGPESGLARLRRWVEADLPPQVHGVALSYAVTYGLPGIEVGRFAERQRADLLVLGRKSRSRTARMMVGDTADAVARRSLLPCLFVPGQGRLPRRILVAIDGSERGMVVLRTAEGFARKLEAELHVVTVEADRLHEPAALAAAVPAARSLQLGARVRTALDCELEVRRGDSVAQILAAVEEYDPDVLALGYHRGGPPGVIDAGSTARRLAHTAPCAILTVPL